jgi:cell division protein FtsX
MFILKYALKNIIRNPFISLSSLVVIGLLVFFINILLLVLFSTDKFIESVNDRISITIPYQSGYTDQSLRSQQLFYVLESSFSGIEAKYVSQDEAFLIFRARNPDLAKLIESTDENPLPSSIQLSGIPLGSYEAVQGTIAQYKDILEYDENAMNRKLIDFQSQYSRIE